MGTVTQQASSTVTTGSVISQNPAAAANVASGSAVNLVVSSGPATVSVPNVVNQTQAAATSAITAAGLTVGSVTTQSSPTVASGSVISQNPAAGGSVASGSAVNLVVSSGPASASNRAPTANAGSNQTVKKRAKVTLSGAASTDPDGTIVSYSWTQTVGPKVTLSSKTSVTPTFTAPVVARNRTITFSLVVTDNSGAKSAAATVNVVVKPTGSTGNPPVANAGLDLTVLPGTLNVLDASNSTDPNSNIASYQWVQTGGPVVKLSSSAAMDPVFLAPSDPATLTFTLVVTDKDGLQTADTVSVVVLPPDGPPQPPPANQPPVAKAGSDRTVQAGSTVTLSGATSTDPDDGIASYQWQQNSGTAVTLAGADTANASFVAPQVGSSGATLTFQLTVTDNAGMSSSDTVNVTVNRSSGGDDSEDD